MVCEGRGGIIYFIALIDKLVSTGDQLEAVHVVEFGSDFVAEQPASAAGGDGPGADILRVAPDEVAEGAFVRDLLGARDDADLVQGADFRAQAPVHAEDFAVDDGAEDEEVEHLAARFPDSRVAVFGHALFVETVDLGDLARFMVATDESDAIGVTIIFEKRGASA